MIENYKFKYRSRGKYFFVPNEKCERRGRRMIQFFSKRIDFPDYFFHYKKGGHVAALHAHLPNHLFFRIDIQNFYYSIARMRVTRALRDWRYPGAGTFAKMVVRGKSRAGTEVRSADWLRSITATREPRVDEVARQ
jgi:hypothetical protein